MSSSTPDTFYADKRRRKAEEKNALGIAKKKREKELAKERKDAEKAAKTERTARQKAINSLKDKINTKRDANLSSVRRSNNALAKKLRAESAEENYVNFPEGLNMPDDALDADSVEKIQLLRDQYIDSLEDIGGYEERFGASDLERGTGSIKELERRLGKLEGGALAQPKTKAARQKAPGDTEPAYGNRPKKGWGRITVGDGSRLDPGKYKKGTEFWIDPNGTMVRREPIGKTGKFRVDRKVEGFDWEHKGVMTGDDQGSFVGTAKGAEDTWDEVPMPEKAPEPQIWGAGDEIPDPDDVSPSEQKSYNIRDTPDFAPEPAGMSPMERRLEGNRKYYNTRIGTGFGISLLPKGYEESSPYDEQDTDPVLSEEDEEYLRQFEEEEELEQRREWAKSQGWGLKPDNYGFEENADYGWY
jgi:hypothetical protein